MSVKYGNNSDLVEKSVIITFIVTVFAIVFAAGILVGTSVG